MHQSATYDIPRDQGQLERAFAALYSDARRCARARRFHARELNIWLLAGNVVTWLYAADSVLRSL